MNKPRLTGIFLLKILHFHESAILIFDNFILILLGSCHRKLIIIWINVLWLYEPILDLSYTNAFLLGLNHCVFVSGYVGVVDQFRVFFGAEFFVEDLVDVFDDDEILEVLGGLSIRLNYKSSINFLLRWYYTCVFQIVVSNIIKFLFPNIVEFRLIRWKCLKLLS